MNLVEAKRTIASYLSGYRRITRAELQCACGVVRSDKEYIQYLAEELGINGDWISECDVFLSHVDEFSDMSEEQREREMPELLRHVEVCPSCRQAYWNVKPLWMAKVGAIKIEKRLTEPIRLITDNVWRLVEHALGPPSVKYETVAATMGALTIGEALSGVEGTERKEWILDDEDAQTTICLVIHAVPSGGVTVSCALEGEPSVTPLMQQVRIEVYDGQRGSVILAGRLSDQTEPINLEQGSYVIKLQSRVHTWEIPIEVQQVGKASEQYSIK